MLKKISKSTIVLVIVFFIGLAVLIYPSVSNYINEINASYSVTNYNEKVSKMSKAEFDEIRDEAKEYNESLVGHFPRFIDGPVKDENYSSILDITGDGMMGYVSIEKLNVDLPFYHGTSNDVLSSAAGHLEGSSLAIGGENTHSVITSHRGLPSAKLFTNLDQLEIGDQFYVSVLDQKLYYEIDKITIILPEEVEELAITSNEDYLTLLTCTPYAVNTHRLLARGVRIETPSDELRITAEAMQIDPILVALIMGGPILTIAFILVLFSPKLKRKIKQINS